MSKLYWNIIELNNYRIFVVVNEKELCFLDFMNNPRLIKNFVRWMTNWKINVLLEHNPKFIAKYLQKNKPVFV